MVNTCNHRIMIFTTVTTLRMRGHRRTAGLSFPTINSPCCDLTQSTPSAVTPQYCSCHVNTQHWTADTALISPWCWCCCCCPWRPWRGTGGRWLAVRAAEWSFTVRETKWSQYWEPTMAGSLPVCVETREDRRTGPPGVFSPGHWGRSPPGVPLTPALPVV